MSEDQIPQQLQEQIVQLQQLQQTFQVIVSQKQQLQVEQSEIEKAVQELEKLSDDEIIYESIGAILIKTGRQKILSELKERKELQNARIAVLERQQQRVEKRINELQKIIQDRMKSTS